MRRRLKGRVIDGMLLLDKRSGVSSNHALQEVKRLLGAAKAGHTGSLDPLASGLLPLCFGQATKLSQFLLNTNKRYSVDIRLGVSTTTGDAEGEIIARSAVPELNKRTIESILKKFTGDITQIPPMHSALKHDGIRLYELARKGLSVDRKPRPITIHELMLVDYQEELLSLNVYCSKGTYIRSLAEDIGAVIGCGGFVHRLRRTAIGDFDISVAIDLETLKLMQTDTDRLNCLLPPDCVVRSMPLLEFSEESVFAIRQGQTVSMSKVRAEGLVRLYTEAQEFFGIGEVLSDQKVAPRRLFG